jgi:hypothetical protein
MIFMDANSSTRASMSALQMQLPLLSEGDDVLHGWKLGCYICMVLLSAPQKLYNGNF